VRGCCESPPPNAPAAALQAVKASQTGGMNGAGSVDGFDDCQTAARSGGQIGADHEQRAAE